MIEMSNTTFYIIAIVAIILAVMVMKYVVSCLTRSIILIVTLAGLALVYYFFVGQYDPKVHKAVEEAVEKVEKLEHHGNSHRH